MNAFRSCWKNVAWEANFSESLDSSVVDSTVASESPQERLRLDS